MTDHLNQFAHFKYTLETHFNIPEYPIINVKECISIHFLHKKQKSLKIIRKCRNE